MHNQMTRLYEAAKLLKGIEGQSDVARAMNASPQTINNWEARGISKSGMLKAQAVFGCSATWLDTGAGQMMLAPPDDPGIPGSMRVELRDDSSSDYYKIPKVQLRLQAGINGVQTEPDNSDGGLVSIPRDWADREGYHPTQLLATKVRGESMEPALYENDVIVINLSDKKPLDGEVYAINYEGEAIVKRMSRDAGEWWLMSDNADQRKYHRKLCRGAECIIIGRVIRREGGRI